MGIGSAAHAARIGAAGVGIELFGQRRQRGGAGLGARARGQAAEGRSLFAQAVGGILAGHWLGHAAAAAASRCSVRKASIRAT